MNGSGAAVFMVGRIDKRGRRVVFVNEPVAAPFPGPWDLAAMVWVEDREDRG